MTAPRVLTLEFQATPEQVMRGVEQLRAFGRAHQIDEQVLFGPTVALEECSTNIVHYACRDQPHERFRVTFERDAETLTIELRDRGPAFDPTLAAARDPATTDDDRPPGGWGIQLVHRFMDEIHYTRAGDENVLRMIKRLAAPAS